MACLSSAETGRTEKMKTQQRKGEEEEEFGEGY